MSATLLEPASETPEALAPCTNCPALQRVERELGALRREVSELRCEVGYWRSRHADAVERNQQLAEELRQAKGEIRTLRDERFGRKSEKTTPTDRSNDLFDPLESSVPSGKRGAQPGQEGHVRRDYSHLPEVEEFISLPTESLACPICGKPAAMMSASEDSELLEIDVRAYRRRIRRRRYRATCDCDPARRTLVAPPPPKLIPKGNYGISIWVHVLLDKYSSYRPTERLLGQLEQYDLDLPAGTVNDGLQRIEPMLQPIYEAFCQRNRQGDFHQADETRWLVFLLFPGKKGYGWWLWVVLAADTVIYRLAPSRGHEVPQSHFGPQASGVLEVDRYSGYKAMAQVKSGLDGVGVLLGSRAAGLRESGQGLAGTDALGDFLAAPHSMSLPSQSGTSAICDRLARVSTAGCLVASRRWRRCGSKRAMNFLIANFANHAARSWIASKSTGRD